MTSDLFRRVGRAAATALLGGTLMLMPGAATAAERHERVDVPGRSQAG
jgi:hypothetical protein